MPAEEIKLNDTQFFERVQTVIQAWNNAGQSPDFESLTGVDALFILLGDAAGEDEPDRKSTAFQIWLLGYEFPSTLMLILKDRIYFVCSATKARFLSQLKGPNSLLPVEILQVGKPKEPPTDAIPKLIEVMASAGKRIGTLIKEHHTGRLVDDWKAALDSNSNKFDNVDIAASLSACMAVKDADELKLIRTSANLCSVLLSAHFVPKLELILDRGSKTSHQALADSIEGKLGDGTKPDMKIFGKVKNANDIDFTSAEFVYPPIVQSKTSSGGYDVRFSAASTDEGMSHEGIILVSFGMKYRGYCANMGRTFLVDVSKTQEQQYDVLLSAQTEALGMLKEGVVARDVYQHVISFIKGKNADLEKHLPKNIGWGMGLEFRDSSYVLSGKNTKILKSGMVFNLMLSLTDLEGPDSKKYSMLLTDTIRVGEEKGVCLTDGMKGFKDVLFSFNDEEPTKSKSKSNGANGDIKPKIKGGSPSKELKGVQAGSKILRAKTRQQFMDPEASTSVLARITEHQRELHAQRQEEGIARFAGEDGDGTKENDRTWKKFQSYKGDAALPKEAETLQVYVDRRNSTVILPVNGFAVPFHINVIKNVSKTDEGEFTYLRINFQTPGQLAGKKEDTPFEDPNATFIRTMSYRSTDGHRFDTLAKQIQELKKEVNKREQEKKAMADVIEQDNLIEIKGKRPLRLPEVFVRPATDGKRLPGDLEIHQNGVRYQSPLGQKVDVPFSNIKHLFFQPCDNEMLVIIHMHLKAPIMIGKKKTKDVQVYREASDVQFDETGNRKRKYRYGDEDEIELEQQERKRRQALNKEFKYFAEKIAEASDDRLEVDIPFSELAFEGVPFRTNVKLLPTTDCVVHLADPPFLVVTLADIEIASLERVQFGLKQFDMVFIFKDFSRPPLHINSIPSNQLDNVKEWLDSVEVPVAEGPVNLNWTNIMKNINENPYEFFKEGGWSFLGGTGTKEDGSDEDESEDESEFAVSDAEEESASESESSFSGDSDASDSDSGASDSIDDSGDDWDELERKAAKADKKKQETNGHGSGSESDRPAKKKNAASSKSKRR